MKRESSSVSSPSRVVAKDNSPQSSAGADLAVDHAPLAAALLEAMPGSAALYSLKGPMKANEAMAEMLGFSEPADFLDQGPRVLLDLFSPDSQPRWSLLLGDVLGGRRSDARGPAQFVGQDGRLFEGDCHLMAVPFAGECCILVTFFSSAEKKQAIDSALADENRFRQLVEAIPFGISRINNEGKLLYVNAAYNKMLGYEPGALTNVNAWDTVIDDTKGIQREFVDVLLRELPRPLPNIVRFRKKNGEIIHVLANWIYDRDENGKVTGFLSVITDVSTRLKVETDLRDAKEAAERANREKSKFLAAASHDLQQPMHSLSILLGLLQRPIASDKQREIVETMGLALDGAMEVLRTVLDMSKLEAGVVKPRFEDFDLESSFDQIKAELGPQISQKPVECRLVQSSAVVHSDRMLLKSILHNLVSNAIRYTSSGKILVGCRRRGGRIRIEVHDTGRGIPEEKRAEIFEEFKRLDGPGQEKQVYALGLGLSIAERTCQLLGSKIKLQSRVGQGSCFSFEVPLAVWSPKQAKPEQESAVDLDFDQLTGRRILLLENDFSTLAHTNMLLESWGCDCMAAETVAQALQESARQLPDLILADYHLNGKVTGVMAAEEVRRMCQTDIPVIIITSDLTPEVLGAVRDHGFTILGKPASPGRLRALMTHFLQSDQP